MQECCLNRENTKLLNTKVTKMKISPSSNSTRLTPRMVSRGMQRGDEGDHTVHWIDRNVPTSHYGLVETVHAPGTRLQEWLAEGCEEEMREIILSIGSIESFLRHTMAWSKRFTPPAKIQD